MCAPSPPKPIAPDYQAQTQSNIETAKATNLLNNPNVITASGSTTYKSGDSFDQAGYDAALADYQQKKAAQDAYNSSNARPWQPTTSENPYAAYGNDPNSGPANTTVLVAPDRKDFTGTGRDTMIQTLSPGQQKIYDINELNQTGLGELAGQGIGSLKGLIGNKLDLSGAPAAPGTAEETRQKVIDSMMRRSDVKLNQANEQQDSDLIAAGIRPGTEAYRRVKEQQGQTRNDLLSQAEQTAGNAASQAYNMDEASRKNYIAELLAQRQTPLNEITALMSGSQTSNPFSGQGFQAGGSVGPVDVNAGTNMLNQYGENVYNQQMASRNNQIGSAATIIAAF